MRLALALLLTACSSSATDDVPCIEASALPACTSAAPTYDELYASTFQPTCAKSGFSCHSPEGHQGNLNYFDKELVYTQMLGHSVRAGSPECSLVVQRVIATDRFVRMPPGASIPAEQQCAVIQWVAAGAKR